MRREVALRFCVIKVRLMKTILLLKETVEKESASDLFNWPPLVLPEDAASVGCTCDRWGHPYPNCRADKPKTQTAGSSSVKEAR